MNNVKLECDGIIDNYTDDILWYLYEYPDQRKEFAKTIKEKFCEMVDGYLKSMEEDE